MYHKDMVKRERANQEGARKLSKKIHNNKLIEISVNSSGDQRKTRQDSGFH